MVSTISNPAESHRKPACSDSDGLHHMSLPGSVPEYLTLSPRVQLVTVSTVCAVRGVQPESVFSMVDDATSSRHIRFAFNVAQGPSIRDLRFWINELRAPALVKRLTVQDAIARILPGRPTFRRSEIEIAWQLSSNLLTDLIRSNFLKCEHGRFSRSALDGFLFARWSGNNPN